MKLHHLQMLKKHYNTYINGGLFVFNPNKYAVTIGDLRDCIPPLTTVNLFIRYKNKTQQDIANSPDLQSLLDRKILIKVFAMSRMVDGQTVQQSTIDVIRPTRPGLTTQDSHAFNGELQEQHRAANAPDISSSPASLRPALIVAPEKINIVTISSDDSTSSAIVLPDIDAIYCQGINGDGSKCKKSPNAGDKYCRHHSVLGSDTIKKCVSLNKNGSPCKNLPVVGNSYCRHHMQKEQST